jgi:hypothetical protein
LISAAASKYSHHNAAAITIAAASAAQPATLSTWSSTEACPAEMTTSPSRMMRKRPNRSAKWCASSRSAGSTGVKVASSRSRRRPRFASRSSVSSAPDSAAIAIAHSA